MSLLTKLIPASVRRSLRHRAMHGATVFCPVCEKGAIAFLPSGTPPRPHVLCPFCHSRERTRMIWLFMKERGIPHAGASVLHVAPEKSIRQKIAAMPKVDYVIGDKHEPGYTYPTGTIELDITDIRFPDSHFDLIICSHVLEHVQDDKLAMRELFRVLAPGGTAILLVPMGTSAETYEDPSITDPEERLRHFGQFDHVRLYGRDYPQRLEEAGFQVEELAFAERFSREEIFRYGLNRGELMHIGTRPAG